MKASYYSHFFLLFTLCSIVLPSCTTSKNTAQKTLTPWQMSENDRFENEATSPLTPEDRESFKGLDFFAYEPSFRVTAQLERTPDAPIFEIATTTDRKPQYRQFGIIRFDLQGQALQLKVYQNQSHISNPLYRKLLFLPFYDASTGVSTYGGGRYINISIPEGDEIIVDFNEAYNPSCAYQDGYSCPITPLENNLQTISIDAGTKAFKKSKH